MLAIEKLNQFYGESHTLWDLDLDVPAGQCTCVMGRNGVGKTTLMKAIMGEVAVKSGQLRYQGDGSEIELTKKAVEARSRLGIGFVPQGRQIFPLLTVEENLRTGLAARGDGRTRWGSVGERVGEGERLRVAALAEANPALDRVLGRHDEPVQALRKVVAAVVVCKEKRGRARAQARVACRQPDELARLRVVAEERCIAARPHLSRQARPSGLNAGHSDRAGKDLALQRHLSGSREADKERERHKEHWEEGKKCGGWRHANAAAAPPSFKYEPDAATFQSWPRARGPCSRPTVCCRPGKYRSFPAQSWTREAQTG